MKKEKGKSKAEGQLGGKPLPPGQQRIINSFKLLMKDRTFSEITVAQIASAARVTEPLIYKYFKDKRDLLLKVFEEGFAEMTEAARVDMEAVSGALNKLRRLIWMYIHFVSKDRTNARLFHLEVENSPGYFQSGAYEVVREFWRFVTGIIEEGIRSGEIRDDISPRNVRQAIMGVVERLYMPRIIFDRDISADALAEDACKLIFDGIAKKTRKDRRSSIRTKSRRKTLK